MEILRTARLKLRRLDENDAPFILELVNEPGWLENIGDRGVRDIEGARRYISTGPVESYRRHGFGLWLVALESGEPIGMCGLIKREGLEDADIGYAILQRHAGRGYAHEAASAVLSYARDVIGLEKVVAIVSPTNAASIAVLTKIGLSFQGMIRLPGVDRETSYFAT